MNSKTSKKRDQPLGRFMGAFTASFFTGFLPPVMIDFPERTPFLGDGDAVLAILF